MNIFVNDSNSMNHCLRPEVAVGYVDVVVKFFTGQDDSKAGGRFA